LVHELMQPETWSKMGAGMMGASLGQAAMGNPLSVVGLVIGLSLLAGGISIGMIKAALKADKTQRWTMAKANFMSQVKELPEVFAIGFFMGLLIGAIQKAVYENQKADFKPPQIATEEQAKKYADMYVAENHLPPYSKVTFDQSLNRVVIHWDGENFQSIYRAAPRVVDPTNLFVKNPDGSFVPRYEGLLDQIMQSPDGSYYTCSRTGYVGPVDKLNFKISLPPANPVNGLVSTEFGAMEIGYSPSSHTDFGVFWRQYTVTQMDHSLATVGLTQPPAPPVFPAQTASVHASLVGATAAVNL
jgi:hypothetical protein